MTSVPANFPLSGAKPTNITTSTTTQIKNAAGIFFGLSVNTGQSGASLALYDGNSATVTISIATPGTVSWANHGKVAGAAIKFATTGALPTGLTAGTTYYVIAAGLTANTFEVSATPGGAAINTSGTQSGVHTAFDVTTPIGAFSAAAQNGVPLPQVGVGFALGLIGISAGGSPADITVYSF